MSDFSISDTLNALVQQDSYISFLSEAPRWWSSDLGGYGPSSLIAQMNCSGLSWSDRVCKAAFNFSGVAVDYIVNYAYCPTGICDEEDEFFSVTESCSRGPNVLTRSSTSEEDRVLPFLRELIKNGTGWGTEYPFPQLCGGEDYPVEPINFSATEKSLDDESYNLFLFTTLFGAFATHGCILKALKSNSQKEKIGYGVAASVAAAATLYLGSYLL